MQTNNLYIGVMSGTSLDGIDSALVHVEDDNVSLLAHSNFPIPSSLKKQLLNIVTGQSTSLVAIGQIDHKLGHLYADAINALLEQSGYKAEQITAIGNHGQTVFHQPDGDAPFTMQLGNANIIACNTGITTIADFRRKDMALGGQGAPLVPAFHQSIFKPTSSSTLILNIGGIANISVLRPNTATIGYDTGPGNMLLDIWIQKQCSQAYDQDAKYALSGKVNSALLDLFLQEDFFSQQAPKSTGRELFNTAWLNKKLSEFGKKFGKKIDSHDVQATLTEFTAVTIANEVNKYIVGEHPELLVCGGGSRNPLIMQRLTKLLPKWSVSSTDRKGVSSEYMEAMAFAWLAKQRIHNQPSNLPEVTGAKRPVSLGVIYPAEAKEL